MVQSVKDKRHLHSNQATIIANGLMVGIIEGQEDIQTHTMSITQVQHLNSVSNCFKLSLATNVENAEK